MFSWINKISFRSRGGCSDNYPFDLDASQRNTRPATGIDYYPTHSNRDNFQKLGCVSGFFPQQDLIVWGQGFAKTAFGPFSDYSPINLQNVITNAALSKQLPQY